MLQSLRKKFILVQTGSFLFKFETVFLFKNFLYIVAEHLLNTLFYFEILKDHLIYLAYSSALLKGVKFLGFSVLCINK